jgi:hypothetical protein
MKPIWISGEDFVGGACNYCSKKKNARRKGCLLYSLKSKMEAARSSETLVSYHNTTRRHTQITTWNFYRKFPNTKFNQSPFSSFGDEIYWLPNSAFILRTLCNIPKWNHMSLNYGDTHSEIVLSWYERFVILLCYGVVSTNRFMQNRTR